MDKPTFKIIFTVVTILAFGCCVSLIIASFVPFMFVVTVNGEKHDLATFGPFNWDHGGTVKMYESVMGSFRFIQVLFVTAATATFLGPLIAIGGYRSKKFKKPTGIIVLVCAVFLGFLAIAYTAQYAWSVANKKLISMQPSIADLVIGSERIPFPPFMISVWMMMCVFTVLGILVLIHKFDN
ncbi:hypothetical protein RF11_06950 [Thelohanellus kitauei]|uniref:Transmembrane protein 182 n=1 Tax=Thelohanellus kitauei TaxID=669202 RepID=A0A0C2MJX6_THEKT|nr:hypothetical protein RF11_06950 [Thelohanellus kitauei]